MKPRYHAGAFVFVGFYTSLDNQAVMAYHKDIICVLGLPTQARRCTLMTKKTFHVIIAAVAILVAAASAAAYLFYKASRDKEHDEKWQDYIDCGVS